MNQRDLECFVKVVDAGSFSQAAILLGRPQPALSRHIRDLEADLNIALLYRNGRGVVLTDAGRRLYTRATAILSQIAEARAEVMAGAGLVSATVGMPASIARILAVPLVGALEAAHPGVQLRIVEGCNGHLLEWMADSRLDVALLYATEASQRLAAEPLISEKMCLVRRADAGPPQATLPAFRLGDTPLLMPGRQHGLRQQVALWAMRHGIELRIRMECDGFAALLQLAIAGVGPAILPAAAVAAEIEQGLLQASLIVEPGFARQIVLATPANRPSPNDLLRLIKRLVRSLDAEIGWSADSATALLQLPAP